MRLWRKRLTSVCFATAVQPPPPQQVTVKKKASSWSVTWNAPPHETIKLLYQLCYYRKDEQVSREAPRLHGDTNLRTDCWLMSFFFFFPQNFVVLNVSAGSTSHSILESFLAPSQDYRVKVRSLVAPGANFTYMGIPSAWSQPAEWTSHEGKKCFLAVGSDQRHSCKIYLSCVLCL